MVVDNQFGPPPPSPARHNVGVISTGSIGGGSSISGIRRADRRFRTDEPGRTTWHSFSFGAHYDPANTGFEGLLCHNDDHIQPGFGYDDHPHANLEIVTWVLDGALTHRHDGETTSVIGAGQVQVLSAGAGVRQA